MADNCHVLQSLIFMMLGHTGETHTLIEYQCSSWYCSISISAHECYNFIFKKLIDEVMYIRKRKIDRVWHDLCLYVELNDTM